MLSLRQKYFEQFTENCLSSVDLTRRKNEGYTGGSNDPYSNFRFAAQLASLPGRDPVTVPQTILSRMADKLSRMKSLIVHPEFSTADESLNDTLQDLFVYSNILLTWFQLAEPEGDTTYWQEGDVQLPLFVEETLPDENVLAVEGEHPLLEKAGAKLADMYKWTVGKLS